MKRMKWGFALLPLLCFGAGIILEGCGVGRGGTQPDESRITIHIMHYWGNTDADISARYFNEILENEFSEAFPGVELVQETCDNETYKKKIKVSIASGEAPDILFSYGDGFMKTFVENGKLLALDQYIDDFYQERMMEDKQQGFVFDGQRYGVGCSSWQGVLYCNQELFDQAGVEIPTTYEELLAACKELRKADIEPIALGMTNRWQGAQWINNFILQLGGAEHYKELAYGEISRDDPVLEQAGQLTADLISVNAFCRDMYKLNSSQAESLFLEGGAAMIYMGSWFTVQAEEGLGDQLVVAKMPTLEGAACQEVYHGGTANGWVVSADTEYPELSAHIAVWLSYQLSAYEPENAAFDIPQEEWKNTIRPAALTIQELYQDQKAGGVNWDTMMASQDASKWLDAAADFWKKGQTGKDLTAALD